jgi:hypothetical protein
MREKSGKELCMACDVDIPAIKSAEINDPKPPTNNEDFISISPSGEESEQSQRKKRRPKKKKTKAKTGDKEEEASGEGSEKTNGENDASAKKTKRYFAIDTTVKGREIKPIANANPKLNPEIEGISERGNERSSQEMKPNSGFKKVHFAETVDMSSSSSSSSSDTQSFEYKQLERNVFASSIAAILTTSEGSFSSHDISDHYRVCKCLSLQLDNLALLCEHFNGEKSIIDMSELHRSLLLRLETIASVQAVSVDIAKLQYKTTKRLCKLLRRINAFN